MILCYLDMKCSIKLYPMTFFLNIQMHFYATLSKIVNNYPSSKKSLVMYTGFRRINSFKCQLKGIKKSI